jgi:hypothetical protein
MPRSKRIGEPLLLLLLLLLLLMDRLRKPG